MSSYISRDEFGFLENLQILDTIGVTQEAFHNIETRNLSDMILHLDLAKAYDRVNWNFVRLILIQIGMDMEIIEWIMGCIQSNSFAVLINGTPSSFFIPTRGVRQGFPLPPFIFLIVADALTRLVLKEKEKERLRELRSQERNKSHTHFLWMMFCCLVQELRKF